MRFVWPRSCAEGIFCYVGGPIDQQHTRRGVTIHSRVYTGSDNNQVHTSMHCCPLGDHLVEITSASGAPCRRALEREGRALASAVQHTRPSMQKMVTAGCPGGPRR